jgi:hypothetical protein
MNNGIIFGNYLFIVCFSFFLPQGWLLLLSLLLSEAEDLPTPLPPILNKERT